MSSSAEREREGEHPPERSPATYLAGVKLGAWWAAVSAWALFADQIEIIETNRERAGLSEAEAIALAIEATRSVRRSRSRRAVSR